MVLPRRVGVNAVFLEPRHGGMDTFVRALVPELVRLAPGVEFCVFCSPGGREYLEGVGWGVGGSGLGGRVELVSHRLLGRRGLKAVSELTLLGVLAGRRVDLLHSLAMTGPLWTRAVNVVMVPDVTWIVAASPGDRWTARLWRLLVPPVARRADRVTVFSRVGAAQVSEYLGVPGELIDVVPLAAGVNELVAPTPAGELRARLGLGEGPVVLTVSAKRVHKNLERLVRAVAALVERWPDVVLVMPGNPTPYEGVLRELAHELGVAGNVVFPAYVDVGDLEGLYALASCFVLASIDEGFGIPILEAMRRGVPVACSRASVLPEVAGQAARYFDPYSVPEITDALAELLGDRRLAGELAARGREREHEFTWEKTAHTTLASYARAWQEQH
jgi:glycosyltransferase involved in cell wall biosynthesis